MPDPPVATSQSRDLFYLSRPQQWPQWPYLPVVRRRPGQPEEYGVVADLFHALHLPGYSATVFLTNLFLLPPTLEQFLALPRECYDTAEELARAGWTVD